MGVGLILPHPPTNLRFFILFNSFFIPYLSGLTVNLPLCAEPAQSPHVSHTHTHRCIETCRLYFLLFRLLFTYSKKANIFYKHLFFIICNFISQIYCLFCGACVWNFEAFFVHEIFSLVSKIYIPASFFCILKVVNFCLLH